ncbi:hypothetical protein ACFQLX_15555 [Streptomyces polyrhachis]|uniref:Proline-rich protein n=1 Tax=Streptomyces polyrhachis TaxID=1282885 RepID=A0ABW2GFT1_9ACTN
MPHAPGAPPPTAGRPPGGLPAVDPPAADPLAAVPRQREPLDAAAGVGFGPGDCDVLRMPAAAGFAVLGRRLRTGPVALTAGRWARATRSVCFLLAPESAAELPGLLRWLEWGELPLELRAGAARPGEFTGAVWLRPPTPDALRRLPALTLGPAGGAGATSAGAAGAPDLVRLVSAAATACHRSRLFASARPGPVPDREREMRGGAS